MEKNIGKIIQIIGPVLDIKFENGHLPNLLNEIEIEHEAQRSFVKWQARWVTTSFVVSP